MIFSIFLLLILFSLSFLISGTETAYFSLKRKDIIYFKKERKFLTKIFHHPERFIVVILVLNNIFNSFASSLFTGIFIGITSEEKILIKMILITVIFSLLLFVFAELFPKNIALLNPKNFSSFITPFFKYLYFIFEKILFPLIFVFSFFKRKIPKEKKEKEFIEDLTRSLSLIEKLHEITREEKILIETIIKAEKTPSKTIMIPYDRIKNVLWNQKVEDILREEIIYSHMPVIYENDIKGIIKIWDILKQENKNKIANDLLTPCSFYDENISVADLFLKMVRNKEEFVILKRNGIFTGFITISDISNFFLENIP
jgi:CBS domain containing-hemolysin-like protein